MKKINLLIIISFLSVTLSACTNEQVGTAVGGASGAALGYAITDNAAGAAIGGAGGALIGNQIGKNW